MAFDFKKEYKEFYMPKNKPSIVVVPSMNYLGIRGKGDHQIDGYFDYVVPPLEGFWWQDGENGIDYARKENFRFISVIRIPDFVTRADFEWAIEEATRKKKTDFSNLVI